MDRGKLAKAVLWLLIVAIVFGIGLLGYKLYEKGNMKDEPKEVEPVEVNDIVVNPQDSFTINMIKKDHTNKNYLISPYSIEIALNMLREGANGQTKEEIDKVIGTREIPNLSIKDKLGIANALFVKNRYQKVINDSFYTTLKSNYDAEILFDEFRTPDVINNWVNEKTNHMIPKILDNMDKDFVLGLANAIALDIKWQNQFECENTSKETFKNNNQSMDVEMMHKEYQRNAKYIKEDDFEGIILPYEKIENSDVQLEFVALMPQNIDNYIKNLSKKSLEKIDSQSKDATEKIRVNLSLPRFTYEYDLKGFKEILMSLGIKKVFNGIDADLTNIISREKQENNLYVDEAIHKTKIELMEKGTKAAAVTYFGVKSNSMIIQDDFEIIDINFNKPFIYMIHDKQNKEILFFGVVYEPNVWKGSTCNK